MDIYFRELHHTDLIELAKRPEMVVEKHQEISMQRCNYAANGAMQTSSAAYNEKSRTQLNLRGVDPAEAVRFNPEFRCQTALTPELLIICYEQLEEFDSEIVRSLAETQTFYGFAYTSKTYDCCYKELK